MKQTLLLKLVEKILDSETAPVTGSVEDFEPVEQVESAFPIGNKVILRGRNAGVLFGTLVSVRSEAGVTVYRVKDSRRLYQWYCQSGITLEDVAVSGIDAEKSKITSTVPLIDVTDSEISLLIPVSDESAKTIESAKDYVVS